jgi:hypothetical protein
MSDSDCIVWVTSKLLDEWWLNLNTRNRADLYRLWVVNRKKEAKTE